ncbi:uncharacterized protein (DUF885 family) [Haloactinopolyspora alba]|uniref:Uncharacterized protein (DUF885 family) n=1 Tax=Haloactinopolyspora alba TaxID=648780 RepID=A0A2P8DVN2_9ACTN|nr:DUF885 domain-containing protein [Haloactinopolyspora alba]PSL01293.1 uncharacterized protein (DUF885 family) [Haloactinopolyspora alba]
MTVVQLADEFVDVLLDANPIEATLLGVRDRDELLPDFGEDAEQEHRRRVEVVLERARAIDTATLSSTDRVTHAVVVQQAGAELDRLRTRAAEYTITDTFFAPAVGMFSSLSMVGLVTQEHADAYLARLAGVPAALEALAERHREGMAAGRVPVRRLTEATVDHFDRYLADPQTDPLLMPQPPADGSVDVDGFDTERSRLLDEVVRPAVAHYRDVLATEVLPHGRPDDRAGLHWLPDGDDFYTRLARVHTTTDRSPAELHQTGLDVIAGLNAEYAEVGGRVFRTGELTEILDRLRYDPSMRWKDGDELLEAARAAIRRAEQVAPRWFGTLPDQQCVVEAVPPAEARGVGAAYYMQPAIDGSRPGTYYANTYQAEKRDRFSSEAVAFHEAVPGHHFQLTLALEQSELPLLRKIVDVTAYIEGWGLYSERLADEMGLYSDDIARLGMLSEDSLRASRLVVDTGLHAMGWSRQQAVDFMLAHTATSRIEIETEVDRYIAAPGQALSYMTGRLEIQRIRAEAERALGERFDIRAFHDVVLGNGLLPLNVLDDVVRAWVHGG